MLQPYGVSMTPRVPGRFPEQPRPSVITGTVATDEFRIANVLPGDYLISYYSGQTDPLANDFGSLAVSVSGSDLADLVLIAKPAAILKGRIVLETGEPVRTWRDYDFTPGIAVENGGTYELRPQSDGTFAIRGLIGRGIEWIGKGHGWYLKAVTRRGQDVTDVPIDFPPGTTIDDIRVVVTREHTEVTGRVRDTAHAPVSEFTVVIFPEDRGRWTPTSRYIATAGADERGRFTIVGLPPGRYLAAALESSTAREYDYTLREAETLERLRLRAAPLRLRTGKSVAVTLSLAER